MQLHPLRVAFDPVQLLRRLGIRLRVLPSDWQTHRVALPDVASDHALMRNVLPDLLPELGFDFETPQRITTATSSVGTSRRRAAGGPGSRLRMLDRHGRWWGYEIGCGKRETGYGRCCGRRGKEGREAGDLAGRKVSDSALVVDLETGTYSVRGVVSDAVERGQRKLHDEETVSEERRRRRGTHPGQMSVGQLNAHDVHHFEGNG